MTNEPQETVSLRDYIEHLHAEDVKRLDAVEVFFRDQIEHLDSIHEQRRQVAFANAQIAIDKAEIAVGKRLDLLNEFRAQVADQTANFVNRGVYEANHLSLENRITQIEASAAGSRRTLAVTFAIAGLFITVVAIIIPLLIHR